MPTMGAYNVLVMALGFYGANATTETEKWSYGVRLAAVPDLITDANLQSFADAARPLFKAFHQGANPGAGQLAWFKGVSVAHIGTDGFYVGGGSQKTTYSLEATPVAGTGTMRHPWSQCVVFTLKGDRDRGRASRGRFYAPAAGQDVQSDGRMSNTAQDLNATAAKTLLDGLNGIASTNGLGTAKVAIVSRVQAGVWQYVTSVGCGARMDAQERRENTTGELNIAKTLA